MSLDDLIVWNSSKRSETNDSSSSLREHQHHRNVIRLPLIFSAQYDIRFAGLECIHPFDTGKWGRVAAMVREMLASREHYQASSNDQQQQQQQQMIDFIEPNHAITDEELSVVHDDRFIRNVKRSKKMIVSTSEICLLYFVPMFLLERCLIRPLRFQTTGTILAAFVALKCRVSINIGGGFHHCWARRSMGFCFFADITLAIRYVWHACKRYLAPIKLSSSSSSSSSTMTRILIVDCDAHQGNGYARDILLMSKEEKKHVYILDLYNARIYPRDEAAKEAINREVRLPPRVQDVEYLKLLNYHLNATIEVDKFYPNFIIFNAGTDILDGDPLGRLCISPHGIIQRDEMVFAFAHRYQIPIMMLLSGGYQRSNARVIADSIVNLLETNHIQPINIVQ